MEALTFNVRSATVIIGITDLNCFDWFALYKHFFGLLLRTNCKTPFNPFRSTYSQTVGVGWFQPTRDFQPLIGQFLLSLLAWCWRLCCCLHHSTCDWSLQIAANSQIKEMSHKKLNRIAAHIPRFLWNNCEKCQMDQLKNDCPVIAPAKLD